jgi:hypothetical protein
VLKSLGDICRNSSKECSSNGFVESSIHRSVHVTNSVPPIDLSELQSLITMQQIHPSKKSKCHQIPWPPRILGAPQQALQSSPAGPTPAIGASRGCESERCAKSITSASIPLRSSLSARRPSPLYSSVRHCEARPKVALVVVQGIENRNVDSVASIPSRHIRAKTLGPGIVEPTAPSAESVQVILPAFHATNYTTSLLAIEVRHHVTFICFFSKFAC